ncbi:MAG TPA: DUF167 domain-containing protein [Albitalea sp.]
MSPAAHDDDTWPCLRATDTGVVLDVSVVPGAKRTEMVGLHGGALRVRLAAPPVDGKANDALIAWLADELSLPRRSIELLRGVASRRKQLRLDCSAAHARAWLVRCCPRG